MFYDWKPYVPVAQRKADAQREMQKLAKKGHVVMPVVTQGRTIAKSFWGKAWCDNLEAYSDFANRLPRGRTYVRNGSVVDLHVREGVLDAYVSGSELYTIKVKIKPLSPARWKAIREACAGHLGSVVELLQGKLSSAVMQVVTRKGEGLFPEPRDIQMECSCPDYASLCKHLAAVLYGVGARLDTQPEVLFTLRGVDPMELVTDASAGVAGVKSVTGAIETDDAGLADLFGIELGGAPAEVTPPTDTKRPRAVAKAPAKVSAKVAVKTATKAPAKPARSRKAATPQARVNPDVERVLDSIGLGATPRTATRRSRAKK